MYFLARVIRIRYSYGNKQTLFKSVPTRKEARTKPISDFNRFEFPIIIRRSNSNFRFYSVWCTKQLRILLFDVGVLACLKSFFFSVSLRFTQFGILQGGPPGPKSRLKILLRAFISTHLTLFTVDALTATT